MVEAKVAGMMVGWLLNINALLPVVEIPYRLY